MASSNVSALLLVTMSAAAMSCSTPNASRAPDAGQAPSYTRDAGSVDTDAATPDGGAPTAAQEYPAWPMPDAVEGAATKPKYEVSPKTVTDTVTQLIWQRELPAKYEGCTAMSDWSDAAGAGGTAANRVGDRCTWEEAKRYCRSPALAAALGGKGWRMPNKIELESLVNHTRSQPAIDTQAFTNAASKNFWTSTLYLGESDSVWTVGFVDGTSGGSFTRQANIVRCVSAPEPSHATEQRYDVMPRIVKDQRTGLSWQRYLDPEEYEWLDAQKYCNYLDLEGRGWRLPTLKELVTLVDPTRYGPAIDPMVFPLTPRDYFWTASVPSKSSHLAGTVMFTDGYTSFDPDNFEYRVRCVR